MKFKYLPGLCLFFALAFVYYRYNPDRYSFFPECPFHKYTGLDCPGCGSQRAVHALLHGHILLAMNYNLLLVLSLPFLFTHFFLKLFSWVAAKDLSWKIWYEPYIPKLVLFLVVVFWVLRNIPVSPFVYLKS